MTMRILVLVQNSDAAKQSQTRVGLNRGWSWGPGLHLFQPGVWLAYRVMGQEGAGFRQTRPWPLSTSSIQKEVKISLGIWGDQNLYPSLSLYSRERRV